jgi:hypothetical protein
LSSNRLIAINDLWNLGIFDLEVAQPRRLHPLVAAVMPIAVVLILTLPRNKAIVPFLLAFFSIPPGQAVALGGLHFTTLRVPIMAGLARVAFYRRGQRQAGLPGDSTPWTG